MTDSGHTPDETGGRPGETAAVEAAYLAVSAYTPEQAVRWQNTANGIMYRRQAEDAIRAAYDAIAAAVLARAIEAVHALPLRTGNPEWSKARDAGQATGYDMGLAVAADAVRAVASALVREAS